MVFKELASSQVSLLFFFPGCISICVNNKYILVTPGVTGGPTVGAVAYGIICFLISILYPTVTLWISHCRRTGKFCDPRGWAAEVKAKSYEGDVGGSDSYFTSVGGETGETRVGGSAQGVTGGGTFDETGDQEDEDQVDL